jgi:hypothetical protein
VQQYLPAGTLFCGRITIDQPNSDFGRTANAILTSLKPIVNGCILKPVLSAASDNQAVTSDACLVTAPQQYRPNMTITENDSFILGMSRRYAPALGRPRRNRPVLLPGSVVTDESATAMPWPLFGKKLTQPSLLNRSKAVPVAKTPQQQMLPIDWKKVTRSQAGLLRELLNPGHNQDAIKTYIGHILEKHQGRDQSADAEKLYRHLSGILNSEGIDEFRVEIWQILNYLRTEIWWPKKYRNAEPQRREGI